MRILITGAGGQIGGDLSDLLRRAGHHVIATDVAAPGPGREADEWHHLDVTDKGAGLTTTEAAKIWDRFARGERHAATTSGSGLGLWIASAFIGANDGKVGATSDGPGLGTTVSIELPVSQDALPQLESGADE